MDERVVKFIKAHHVLTLATTVDGAPYCSNMFYGWIADQSAFVFTSDPETRHAREAVANPKVAGSVVLETKLVGDVRGVQFCGEIFRPEGELYDQAKSVYLKRFPYATVMKLDLWLLRVDYVKMTDNRLGFGKKIIWQR